MKVWRAFLAVAGLVSLSSPAFAQSSTSGDIQGVIRDPSGKNVAAATVVANGPQGARATTTDAEGNYLIEYLTPGTYDVTATAQGFQPVTQRGVQVRLGTRVTLNLALAPLAEAEETVTITAAPPTVDTSATSVTTSISSDLIGAIPTSRSFTGLLNLAPGVVDGGVPGSGNQSIGGASGLENVYLVNGVNITNQGYGAVGSYSIVYGSLGSGVNFDFIDQVNVRGGGFEAEYGEGMGGVIQVTTKRGTNEYHGSVFGNWQPGELESARKQVNLTAVESSLRGPDYESDLGVTVGGPIVKDKAFFFLAANPQQESEAWTAPANLPLAALGTQYQKHDRTSYAADLTWNVAPNHTLDLSLFGDPGVSEYGPQFGPGSDPLLNTSTAAYSSLKFGGDNQILRYTGVLGSFMSVEATYARAANTFGQSFPGQNDQPLVQNSTVIPNTFSGGVGFYEAEIDQVNTQYSLKFTNYLNAGGRHELKYGVTYEDISYDETTNYTGPSGLTFTDEHGVSRSLTTGYTEQILSADNGSSVYRVNRGLFSGQTANTDTQYTALFIQDKYSPTPTLTLDIGLRTDQQHIDGGGNGAEGWTFFFADNIAPRLGASWDFTGKGKGKVYAHYGRFIQHIPNDLAVRELSVQAGVSFVDFSNPGLSQQIPNGTDPIGGSTTHVSTNGSIPTVIAPGTKSAAEDEYVLGAEYEPVETVNVGLSYIHRSLARVLEDFQRSAADNILAPGGGFAGYGPISGAPYNQTFGAYNLGNPGTSLNSTCPPNFPNCWFDPERIYDALQLTVEKRLTTNWQMLASYRLARLYGNYEGAYREDNGQSDPFITSLFDFPNNTPLMQGQGQSGLMNSDRTHIIKMAASYLTAVGINVGTDFNFATGTPITELLSHPIYQNTGEVPLGARGAFGRTPNHYTVDLHADYPVAIRKGLDLKVAVDVFNVLDNQEVYSVIQDGDLGPGIPNPDFLKTASYVPPRSVRLGAKLVF